MLAPQSSAMRGLVDFVSGNSVKVRRTSTTAQFSRAVRALRRRSGCCKWARPCSLSVRAVLLRHCYIIHDCRARGGEHGGCACGAAAAVGAHDYDHRVPRQFHLRVRACDVPECLCMTSLQAPGERQCGQAVAVGSHRDCCRAHRLRRVQDLQVAPAKAHCIHVTYCGA